MKMYIPIGLVLLLGGCAATAERALNASADTQIAGWAYVTENWAFRQSLRAKCRDILDSETDDLIKEGKYDEARDMINDFYSPLVTHRMITAISEGQVAEQMNMAIGCQKWEPRLPGPIPSPGPLPE